MQEVDIGRARVEPVHDIPGGNARAKRLEKSAWSALPEPCMKQCLSGICSKWVKLETPVSVFATEETCCEASHDIL